MRRLSAPLTLYRIADRRYPLFSGRAAGQVGFRWNPRGIEVIYASVTYAGAMLARMIHTETGSMAKHQVLITISVPAGVRVEELDPALHPGWRRYAVSQRIGRRWVEQAQAAILLVPSIVYEGHNALINLAHPDAASLTVSRPRQVRWEKRLFSA